jgi:fumarate hydratase class II
VLELNGYKPVIVHAILESVELLADACGAFDRFCAAGLEADVPRMDGSRRGSLMLATALVPAIGYDRAAKVARKAHVDGTTLREAALALGVLSADEFDRLVVPSRMLGPDAG